MRPPLVTFGDHRNFEAYQADFDRAYKENRVIDVFGDEIVFGHAAFNGPHDCHHVCFGGSKASWGNPAKWHQDRAERILWIGPALSDPGIKVYAEPQFAKRRRYLLVVDADPAQGLPTEYFCAIAEIIGAKRKAFITAYNITRETWDEYKKVRPRYYPPLTPGETTGKKKKKKGTA